MDNFHLFLSSVIVASAGRVFSPGGLLVSGEKVLFCGRGKEASRLAPMGTKKVEYPGAVIVPGFVNAHTHLTIPELEQPGDKDFVGWLLNLLAWRMAIGEDGRETILEESLSQCMKSGITAAGEISGADLSLYERSKIRLRAYLELLGMEEERWKDGVNAIETSFQSFEKNDLFRLGISPHSLYTCSAPALKRAGELSSGHNVPLQIHLAESRSEVEFVRTGSGEIRERIYAPLEIGDGGFSGYGHGHLDLLEDSLPRGSSLVHGTYLTRDELGSLEKSGFTFIFCIRSNRYLTGEVPLLDVIVDGDGNFGIGTDSRGSCGRIDMFEEMRAFADSYHGSLRWKEFSGRLFDGATRGGSVIVGFSDLCGSLEEDKMADFFALEISTDEKNVLPHIIEKGESDRIEDVRVAGRSVISS